MSTNDSKGPTVTITSPPRPRRSSTSSTAASLRTPRTARFAEATAIVSPIEPSKDSKNPFKDPPTVTNHYQPQPQPSDFGFGYLGGGFSNKHNSVGDSHGVEMEETDNHLPPVTPGTPGAPLKSALKSPGAPPKSATILSPTFREEQILEKREESTEKEQAVDLVSSQTNTSAVLSLTVAVESQVSRTRSEVRPSWRQL
jgi:hypothetical protein